MGERDVRTGLFAVDGNVPNFYLQMKWYEMKTADLGASAGDPLDLGHHAAPNVGLKGCCSDVPGSGNRKHDKNARDNQKIFPPAAESGGGFGHRDWTPSSGDPVNPGALTLLSERKVCSHDTINSFTFSWVRSSRIFAETSASET